MRRTALGAVQRMTRDGEPGVRAAVVPAGEQSGGAVTIASLAKDWAQRAPRRVAMREKRFGVWQEYTWADVWESVETAAHGLLALGVEAGDRVAVHSEDRHEWVILDLASVAVRAVTVGLYPTNPTAEVEHIVGDCTPVVYLAEDQEQADKMLEASPEASRSVRRILYVEPRGFGGYSDPRLLSWGDFLEMGRSHRGDHADAVADRMSGARSDDTMTLVYTSGTTGPPKGAMLSNANAAYCMGKIVGESDRYPGMARAAVTRLLDLLSGGRSSGRRSSGSRIGPLDRLDDDASVRGRLARAAERTLAPWTLAPNPGDFVLTYLPLCHVAERVFSTWTLVGTGPSLNFAESIDTVAENLREVQPTLFFAVPRIWERMHATVRIKGANATWFKRLVLASAMRMAASIGARKSANGGRHTPLSFLLHIAGQPLAFRAMKERLGLRRCRLAISAAAPIAPEVLEFFIGIGVPVFELYGMTENSAVATCNFAGRMKLGTVGEPYRDIDFRIDDDTGEIQVRHPGVFQGYWNKPDKTAETFTGDGWLMTGDVGEWVDGTHVRIVDRIKHIIITSGGKNISPSEIENSLKTSPYVKEAMVIGDRRKYVTALIGIELETVGDWAQREAIPYTTYRDLSEREEVVSLISEAVQITNSKFARVEQIKKFRLLPKELDHMDGELTATQKLKRAAMEEAFGDLVESMY